MLIRCSALLLCASAVFAADTRLTNVSVRSHAGVGADTLIVGFTLGGTGTKPVVLRAIGPSLGPLGVTDAIANPVLKLLQGDRVLAENDDWQASPALTNAFAVVGAFPLEAGSRDAVLVGTLGAGTYTAQVETTSSGTALVECYDGATANGALGLRNISARTLVATDGTATVGFALVGTTYKLVFIRGVGPGLAGLGVSNAMPNPRVRVYSSRGTMVSENDDWSGSAGTIAVANAVGAFALTPGSGDATLVQAMAPGAYTAQISPVDGRGGVALVELYEVSFNNPTTVTLQPVSNPVQPLPAGLSTSADTLPRPLSGPNPAYPAELRGSGVIGEVILVFTVTAQGDIADASVASANDVRFGDAALAALLQRKYEPALSGGQPVPVRLTLPVIFTPPTSG